MDDQQAIKTFSLQKRLILAINALIMVFLPLLGVYNFYNTYNSELSQQDKQLSQFATLISNVLKVDKHINFMFEVDQNVNSKMVIDIFTDEVNKGYMPGLNTISDRQSTWRQYVLHIGNRTIVIKQTLNSLQTSALIIAIHSFLPIFLLMLLLSILVVIIVRRAFAPVYVLSADIASKTIKDYWLIRPSVIPKEIYEFFTAINHMIRRVESSYDEQNHFIMEATHELRSPLSALKIQIQYLNQHFSTKENSSSIHKMLLTVERLSNLLEQMLAHGRTQFSVEVEQATLFNEVILDTLGEMVDALEFKQLTIDLQIESSLPIKLNHWQVKTIVKNVIDNAIKYTPHGSTLLIKYSHNATHTIMEFHDNGLGVEDKERDLILNPFHRVLGSDQVGSGLGLSIINNIVKKHCGSITISKQALLGGLSIILMIPFQSDCKQPK